MELLVNTNATSHTIREKKKFKNYDQTFQPENHYIKLTDGTINSSVALKRGDAEVCLLDADRNHVMVSLKKGTTNPLLLAKHIFCNRCNYKWSNSYF